MTSPRPAVVAVPDLLLTPLLDTAGEVLRGLGPDAVPAALRPLAGFDRRGLTSATARTQLRRAFDLEAEFRTQVQEAFVGRAEVASVLEGWSPDRAVDVASDAATRDDLPVLVSALYVAQPEGFEFGLGVACGEDQRQRVARNMHDDARANGMQLATAEEARRRADDALAQARSDVTRLEGELREERRGRRDREAQADRQAAEADRRAREAEGALDKGRRDLELAETRARRESERAREAERQIRELKRSGAVAPEGATGPDRAELADLARRARAVADGLTKAAAAAAAPAAPAPAPTGAARAPKPRRMPVPCPPGLHVDEPKGLDAMLRTRGVVLVVDGYNVSMSGWPGTAVDRQRDSLVSALERLHLRLRCDVVVVFDGADVQGVTPRRTPGVHVVFSAAGEPADPLIVAEVAALPLKVPVLVASNDGWVRDHAGREGATPVASGVLLDVLRR